ncbi:helix-turn-helix transcriptional regulator [Comamonas sp. J-3]|uniref:helix-turn-helix transcriptional regulator n=1 Tax=Comamonas trifloxystrobinivorans TaxID=3350256 RepID=UPI003729B21A
MVQFNSSLRPKAAAEYLGIGVSTLWRWSKDRSDFPKARKLGPRCTVFNASELQNWRDAAPLVHNTARVHSAQHH